MKNASTITGPAPTAGNAPDVNLAAIAKLGIESRKLADGIASRMAEHVRAILASGLDESLQTASELQGTWGRQSVRDAVWNNCLAGFLKTLKAELEITNS